MNNLFDVSGKVALVTGSGQGIGFTLASGLAEAGCNLSRRKATTICLRSKPKFVPAPTMIL